MKVDYVKVNVEIKYNPTYIGGIPHFTSANRDFYITEEDYSKILEILEK